MDEGYDDDEILADVYVQHSQSSQLEALQRGITDEQYVKRQQGPKPAKFEGIRRPFAMRDRHFLRHDPNRQRLLVARQA